MDIPAYDPFAPGRFPVSSTTLQARDEARDRVFPCDFWYPTQDTEVGGLAERDGGRGNVAGLQSYSLIVYSHSSGGNRRSSTFLCRHLTGHGYVVAALDHSELVAKDLARHDGETATELSARIEAVIAARVPDVRFLLDYLLDDSTSSDTPDLRLDVTRIGLVGHSFGGWTVLATPEPDPRIGSVVALAPGGSSRPRPGILPVTLTFAWGRDVPVLYLAAENDVPVPLDRVTELFDRTPGSRRMFVLRRADHQHFVDDVEQEHEALRAMSFPGDAAWIPGAMRPIAELSSGEQAHLFVRGLTLAHLDATLRGSEGAERFLSGDVVAELAARGVEAVAYRP